MLNDETQEVVTSTNDDTAEEVDTTEETVDTTDYKAEALKWKAIAERKAKKLEEKPAQAPVRQETGTLSEDDILVITTLQDKELIERARKIARLEGITLAEAVNNPMFTYAKQAYEEEQRKEKASMEASRGSGSRGQKKTLGTAGLSKQEHKELWKNRVGR
jgi:hypothetical protein